MAALRRAERPLDRTAFDNGKQVDRCLASLLADGLVARTEDCWESPL